MSRYYLKVSFLIILLQHFILLIASRVHNTEDEYWYNLLQNPSKAIDPTQSSLLYPNPDYLKYFSTEDQQALNQIVTRYLTRPNEKLWSSVQEVDPDHPFIFFHQRKAGGSSIRETLLDSAKKLGITAFVPCYTAPCDTTNIPNKPRYSIYAAHLRYGAQQDLLRFNSSILRQFSCATNIRNPFHRILSCFHFRFFEFIGDNCLMDLNMTSFQHLFIKKDYYGTSCLNEPFRALSGILDDDLIDHLMDGNALFLQEKRRQLLPESGLALAVFNLTMRHIEQCSPVILEIPLSYELMNRRIPKLGITGGFVSGVQAQFSRKRYCPSLTGEKLQYLQQQIALEMMLYDAVYKKTLTNVQQAVPDYFYQMKCKVTRNNKTFVSENDIKQPDYNPVPLAFVAENSMDSAAIRSIFEQATGLLTGALYPRLESGNSFLGETTCGKNNGAIYAEPDHIAVSNIRYATKNPFVSFSSPTSNLQNEQQPSTNTDQKDATTSRQSTGKIPGMLIWNRRAMKKCKRGGVLLLERLAVLVNDPFYVFYRKYLQMKESGKEQRDIRIRDEESFLSVIDTKTDFRNRRKLSNDNMKISLSEPQWTHRILQNVMSSFDSRSKGNQSETTTMAYLHENIFSLFMDYDTFYALCQSYHSFIVAHKDELKTWDDLELILSNTTLRQNYKILQYPREDLMYYSFQSIYFGVHNIMNQAKDYGKYDAEKDRIEFSEDYSDGKINPNDNAFLHLIYHSGHGDKLIKRDVQCLFPNVPCSLYIIDDIQAMYKFYESNPIFFKHVKSYIKKWMSILQIHYKQVHYLYSLQ